ncbi:MAG: ChaN family lipoprotein, partial [Armatimonadetes bacterium]|nr:ChaN family lipoprotein [Armatimonadota bacterium]
MLTWISAACLGLLAPTARADYLLTDSHGQPCGYEALVTAAAAAEVVLFGELHDSAVVHRLQLQFARDLHTARGGQLDLGLEMLETDTQLVLDEFLAGLIRPQDLQSEAKVWKNHATDYQPLLDWARETGLRVTASNVPRRYAALVAREGLAALE